MVKEEDVIRLLKDAEQAVNENRGSDMESYLDGRLSAFEEIRDILKDEKNKDEQ